MSVYHPSLSHTTKSCDSSLCMNLLSFMSLLPPPPLCNPIRMLRSPFYNHHHQALLFCSWKFRESATHTCVRRREESFFAWIHTTQYWVSMQSLTHSERRILVENICLICPKASLEMSERINKILRRHESFLSIFTFQITIWLCWLFLWTVLQWQRWLSLMENVLVATREASLSRRSKSWKRTLSLTHSSSDFFLKKREFPSKEHTVRDE